MERTKGLGRGDDTTAFRRVSRQWPRRFIVMLQRHVGTRDRATVSSVPLAATKEGLRPSCNFLTTFLTIDTLTARMMLMLFPFHAAVLTFLLCLGPVAGLSVAVAETAAPRQVDRAPAIHPSEGAAV